MNQPHCITCGGNHGGDFCPRTKQPDYKEPIGVIIVNADSIEVRQLHHNGFTETTYPEPTVQNLNDAARVLGMWMNLNVSSSSPFPQILHHYFPPLPPLFKKDEIYEPPTTH